MSKLQELRNQIYTKLIALLLGEADVFEKVIFGAFYIESDDFPIIKIHLKTKGVNGFFEVMQEDYEERFKFLQSLVNDLRNYSFENNYNFTALSLIIKVTDDIYTYKAEYSQELINDINPSFLKEWRSKYLSRLDDM